MNNQASTEADRGFAQISQESITTWAESVGISDLSPEVGRMLASDTTYRLRQVLHSCTQHLHACKRKKLNTDDFNRVLGWMDVPSVLGHSGCAEAPEWLHVPEVGVHIVQDNLLSLASTAVTGDIYHQPGNPCVKGEWAHITNHVSVKGEGSGEPSLSPLSLSPPLIKYYHTLVSAIFGHSSAIFSRMEKDLSTNPCLEPLVGAIVSGCLRGAQIARQNPCILRRVLLVIRAMLANTHMHAGHAKYVRDIMSLIVFCVVTERKQSYDTHPIRSLATNTMLKVLCEWSEGRNAWDVAVTSLGAVIASTSRPWSQHSGALSALLALGPPAQVSLMHYYSTYYNRLEAALNTSPTAPYVTSRDALDAKAAQGTLMAVLIKIASSYIHSLPDRIELNLPPPNTGEDSSSSEGVGNCKKESQDSMPDTPKVDEEDEKDDIFNKLRQVYLMGESWFGSPFVLQIPSIYLCHHKNRMPSFMESHIYKEMQTTGEALLKDVLSREENNASAKNARASADLGGPFAKRIKVDDSQTFVSSFSPQQSYGQPPPYGQHQQPPPPYGQHQPPPYGQQSISSFSGQRLPSYGQQSPFSEQPPSFGHSTMSSAEFDSLFGDTTIKPGKNLPDDIFSIPQNQLFYKRLTPQSEKYISINLQDCNAWENDRLKRPKGLMPKVKEHPHRHLLTTYFKSKPFINKMPHCKFSRPLHPKIRPGYSLHHVSL